MAKRLNRKRRASTAVTSNVTVVLAGGDSNPAEIGVYHLTAGMSVDGTLTNFREVKLKTLMTAYQVNRVAASLMLSDKNLFDFVVFPGHLIAIG